MRKVMLAGAVLALVAADGASAQQRVVMHGPGSAPQMAGGGFARPGMVRPNMPPRVGYQGRWGSKVGGHWWGGVNAPGGWHAYRRPVRGWTLPSYWYAPRFYVSDWSTYGLAQPQPGYTWVRYYDDAVLVDGRGSVYDSVPGVDWDRYDDGYYAQDSAVYADGDARGYDERYDRRDYRRDDGVGGAVAGAVVGGVAGNLIAGRGNRLGGTLIGAGVGAAAGYAIDKSEDRRREGYGYGAGYGRPGRVPVAPDYPPPPPAGYAPPPPPRAYAPPPPPVYARPAPVVQALPAAPAWRSADGTTTVTTTSGAGYVSGGYYVPGASTTTVVVQTQPVVTTTTTEIYEDAVTYTRRRPAVHTKTKRVWRPAPKCACR